MTTNEDAINAWLNEENSGSQSESTEADEAEFALGYFRVRWGEEVVVAWAGMPDVSPLAAARFLKGQNPEGETTQFGDTLPDGRDVLRLAGVFEAVAKVNPAHRSLRDWLDVAQQRGLTVNRDMAAIVRVAAQERQPVQPQAAAPRPMQRAAAQEAAILATIRQHGYDPTSLPKNEAGKPGVKAIIRAELEGESALFPRGSTVFDKAWERLRANGDIADRP